MSANSNGLLRAGMEKLNQFALVIYFPDPLAQFLDELRLELVKGCRPRAHVTVLPPRPLTDVNAGLEEARILAPDFPPFQIEGGEIEIFPQTNVIFIGLRRGERELHALHDAMNTGPLAFREPYKYHPHVTLAQHFPIEETKRVAGVARKRWDGYTGPLSLQAERMECVQNTRRKCWFDLATSGLGEPAHRRK